MLCDLPLIGSLSLASSAPLFINSSLRTLLLCHLTIGIQTCQSALLLRLLKRAIIASHLTCALLTMQLPTAGEHFNCLGERQQGPRQNAILCSTCTCCKYLSTRPSIHKHVSLTWQHHVLLLEYLESSPSPLEKENTVPL